MEKNKTMIEAVEKKAAEATSKAVANFWALVEYQDKKIEFFVDTYDAGKQLVWDRITVKHPKLNLNFLDEVWKSTAVDAPVIGISMLDIAP